MNIYHPRSELNNMGKTIRFNLRGVKLLLDRKDIKSFTCLTEEDRELFQRRVDEYCRHSKPTVVGYIPAKLLISRMELELIVGRPIGNINALKRRDRERILDAIPELESMDFEMTMFLDLLPRKVKPQSPPIIDQFPDAKAVAKARKIR